jgi:hypothetical protein
MLIRPVKHVLQPRLAFGGPARGEANGGGAVGQRRERGRGAVGA